MPGCYGVKFIPWWNWLKIEIKDLQAPYCKAMSLVFLDPSSPYPKKFETLRGRHFIATLQCSNNRATDAIFLTPPSVIHGVIM